MSLRMLRVWVLLVFVGCLLPGCLRSLHPIYTESNTVFRDELLGDYWYQLGMGSATRWKIEAIDDQSYRGTRWDTANDVPESYIIHLVEMDDNLYIDYYRELDAASLSDVTPVHHIGRIRFVDGTPVIAGVDLLWLSEYIEEHPEELSMTTVVDKVLVTADTEELQRFIVEHADDGLFKHEMALHRVPAHAP